jgi:hypothetical protein
MAKARASSSAKSDTKKPAAKGSAASSKKKADEPKSAAPAKGGAKKTAAVPAKPAAKAGTPSQGTKATQAAGGGDKGKHLEAKPAKTEAATRAEPAKPSSAPEPQPATEAAEPAKQTASAPAAPPPKQQPKAEIAEPQASAQESEVAPAEKPPEQGEAAAAPGTPPSAPEAPKPEYEPIGPNALDGFELPSVYGKAGVFGGPKDHSAKADDKLALPTGLHFQYERYRSLNPKSFYCAMRWDYRQQHKSTEEGKRWWANKKLLVANPSNGKSVVVRAMDYGPHESTGFAIAVSPGAAEALGINPGDEVLVAFADPKAPTGAVG